jgi:hypothetical protein
MRGIVRKLCLPGEKSDFDAIGPRLKKGLGRRGEGRAAPMCVRNCEESLLYQAAGRSVGSVGRSVRPRVSRSGVQARCAQRSISTTRSLALGSSAEAHTHTPTYSTRARANRHD